MADRINVSESNATAIRQKIVSESLTWLNGMSKIKNKVGEISRSLESETGLALIELFERCQREIKSNIENFITEYNRIISLSVSKLQSADAQIASSIGSASIM